MRKAVKVKSRNYPYELGINIYYDDEWNVDVSMHRPNDIIRQTSHFLFNLTFNPSWTDFYFSHFNPTEHKRRKAGIYDNKWSVHSEHVNFTHSLARSLVCLLSLDGKNTKIYVQMLFFGSFFSLPADHEKICFFADNHQQHINRLRRFLVH